MQLIMQYSEFRVSYEYYSSPKIHTHTHKEKQQQRSITNQNKIYSSRNKAIKKSNKKNLHTKTACLFV